MSVYSPKWIHALGVQNLRYGIKKLSRHLSVVLAHSIEGSFSLCNGGAFSLRQKNIQLTTAIVTTVRTILAATPASPHHRWNAIVENKQTGAAIAFAMRSNWGFCVARRAIEHPTETALATGINARIGMIQAYWANFCPYSKFSAGFASANKTIAKQAATVPRVRLTSNALSRKCRIIPRPKSLEKEGRISSPAAPTTCAISREGICIALRTPAEPKPSNAATSNICV